MTDLGAYWAELVRVAALGTDRRDPPAAPTGPLGVIAVDDRRASADGRLLQQAAVVLVARRAGQRPLTTTTVTDDTAVAAAPPVDLRPMSPPSATATWARIVDQWPVLEDEWLREVGRRGWRLAPELVVPLLERHRRDATRMRPVRAAAGPTLDWLLAELPALQPAARRPAPADDAALDRLPDLAVTPALQALLEIGLDAPDHEAVPLHRLLHDLVLAPLCAAEYGSAHRPVLVHALARVHPASLGRFALDLREALGDGQVHPSCEVLAHGLVELVELRVAMLAELRRPPAPRAAHHSARPPAQEQP